MVSTQYPEEFRPVHTPSHWQRSSIQSKQTFCGFPHRPEPQPSTATVGSQHCGQYVACSSKNFVDDFGVYKTSDTGQKQRQPSKSASPSTPSSTALQKDSFELATEASSLHKRGSAYGKRIEKSHPLLNALLRGSTAESTANPVSSLSNTVGLKTTTFSERHCKRPQVKSAPASQNFERIQNMRQTEGTHFSLPYFYASSSPLSSEPIEDDESFQAKTKAFLEREVAEYRRLRAEQARNNSHISSSIAVSPPAGVTVAVEENSLKGSKTSTKPSPQSEESAETATSFPEKQYTEYPQGPENVLALHTEDDDESLMATSAVPKVDKPTEEQPRSSLAHSPFGEHDKGPALDIKKPTNVVDQVPCVTRTSRNLMESDRLEEDTTSVEGVRFDSVVNVLREPKTRLESQDETYSPMSPHDDGAANKENMIAQQQCSDFSGESKTLSRLSSVSSTSPGTQLGHSKSCGQFNKDGASLFSQTENKEREPMGQVQSCGRNPFEITTVLNPEYDNISDDGLLEGMVAEVYDVDRASNPQYEDISDCEPTTELSNINTKSSLSTHLDDFQYEPISDNDDPEAETVTVEWSSQVHEPNNMLLFDKEGSAHLQKLAQTSQAIETDKKLNPKRPVSPKTETFDSPHQDYASCFDEPEELDDELEDDWIMLPITILDLMFVQEGEKRVESDMIQKDSETVVTENYCEKNHPLWPVPQPGSASVSSEIEVFDTVDSFVEATEVQIVNQFDMESLWGSPDSEIDEEGPDGTNNSQEQVSDEYDTEDSCDYPSDPKHNHMTVSRKLIESSAASPNPAAEVTVSQEEGVDKVKELQKSQTDFFVKFRGYLTNKATSSCQKANSQQIPRQTGKYPHNSDSEEESDQRRGKRKKRRISSPESSEEASCGQYGKQSPIRVDSQCRKDADKFQGNCVPSADLESPQCQSRLDGTQLKDTIEDANLSTSTEKGRQVDKGDENCMKTANERFSLDSEYREDVPYTNKPSLIESEPRYGGNGESIQGQSPVEINVNSESIQLIDSKFSIGKNTDNDILVLDTDSEDEGFEVKRVTCRSQNSPSDSGYEVDPSCITEDVIIITSESEEENGENSITPQSTETDGKNSGQLASGDTATIAGKKCPSKRIKFFPSSSEDSDDNDPTATKNRCSSEPIIHPNAGASRGPKQDRQSSEGLPEKQHQSADGFGDPTMVANVVIPRFIVSDPDHPRGRLKLHPKGGNRTPKKTKANTDLSKKNEHSNRNKSHLNHKAPLVARQYSLPNHLGASASNACSSSKNCPLTESKQSSPPVSAMPLYCVSKQTLDSLSHPMSKQRHLTTYAVQQPFSYSSPSASDQPHSPPEGPSSSATLQTDGRKKVMELWNMDYIDTHYRRRRSGGDGHRSRRCDSSREDRPGPSHCDLLREARPQRSPPDLSLENRPEPKRRRRRSSKSQSSAETTAPLMKKALLNYMMVPKVTSRDPAKEQSGTVGENYKWSERRTLKKGPSRDGKL